MEKSGRRASVNVVDLGRSDEKGGHRRNASIHEDMDTIFELEQKPKGRGHNRRTSILNLAKTDFGRGDFDVDIVPEVELDQSEIAMGIYIVNVRELPPGLTLETNTFPDGDRCIVSGFCEVENPFLLAGVSVGDELAAIDGVPIAQLGPLHMALLGYANRSCSFDFILLSGMRITVAVTMFDLNSFQYGLSDTNKIEVTNLTRRSWSVATQGGDQGGSYPFSCRK